MCRRRHTTCGIYLPPERGFSKKDQGGGGGGIRTHEPLRDGITHLAFFYLQVLREEICPHAYDLESCAFDQASLPLHSSVLPV